MKHSRSNSTRGDGGGKKEASRTSSSSTPSTAKPSAAVPSFLWRRNVLLSALSVGALACVIVAVLLGRPRMFRSGDGGDDSLFQQYRESFEGLKTSLRVSTELEVRDFGHGVGMRTLKGLQKDEVVMHIPESAIVGGSGSGGEMGELKAELRKAVDSGSLSEKAAFIIAAASLKVRGAGGPEEKDESGSRGKGKGGGEGTDKTNKGGALQNQILGLMPAVSWHRNQGLFSISRTDFNVTAWGTTMETWREEADIAVDAALEALGQSQSSSPSPPPPLLKSLSEAERKKIGVEELRWAWVLLHSHGLPEGPQRCPVNDNEEEKGGKRWTDSPGGCEKGKGGGSSLPLPLFFLRPSPVKAASLVVEPAEEGEGGVRLVAGGNIKEGEEVFLWTPQISDAWLLAFRGVFFRTRHRMVTSFNFTAKATDADVVANMTELGCGPTEPFAIQRFDDEKASINRLFYSCLRLGVAAEVPKLFWKLRNSKAFMGDWPRTRSLTLLSETSAITFGADLLKSKLDRLVSSSEELKQRLSGAGTVGDFPLVQVRAEEVELLVGILRTIREVMEVIKVPVLFDAYQEAEGGRPVKSSLSAGSPVSNLSSSSEFAEELKKTMDKFNQQGGSMPEEEKEKGEGGEEEEILPDEEEEDREGKEKEGQGETVETADA
uniref:Uncharacterized protein n=1 Tax=Chromera velia CCMP2878 TaxID=1169474 RepID=A0A0G4FR39_9ALVE|eukprot:Cvel_18308.t1-p1 / transcript=Cvel_18308.t1 / gene=Cvel_18308 / organism=Chromera_velia_CCMP2878 / gene_product=hypothetical protein / transcript_product=hypothetical protein / location=Cvel_scaffold1510:13557-22532(+) / protein_length=660 / sequence_SO=supercontig / SO=protein_coding / is_pseudo=false